MMVKLDINKNRTNFSKIEKGIHRLKNQNIITESLTEELQQRLRNVASMIRS